MARYLITGRGGSGKTTTCKTLRAQGFDAFDADDIPGLARWEDRKTGQPVTVDYGDHVYFEQAVWNWNGAILKAFLGKHPDVFLCGSASNYQDFIHFFDKVFILVLTPETHVRHLAERDSPYGKLPKTRDTLIRQQKTHAAKAMQNGAVPIDTNGTPAQNVTQILNHLDDRTRVA
jgi:broad-specificity NMP kinase